jgi:hypothetical protein
MNDPQQVSAGSGAPQASPDATQSDPRQPGPAEHAPDVVPVDEAIRLAAEEVRKAAKLVVRSLQGEAADRLKSLRESPVVGPVDRTLDLVRRYPIPGALIALLVGFFLGRTLSK